MRAARPREEAPLTLTSQMVKAAAFKAGCGDIGIANIERFDGAPRMMHPKNIFPDCKSVITIAQPIPRGSYRGITEGTHWGDVHMGRCTLTHHGLNWEASPFLKKDVPGFNLDVRHSNLSEEAAYKLTYPLAQAKWRKTLEFPADTVMTFYNQIISQTGYFAVCGAKGCIRSCMVNLEKRKSIDQRAFPTAVFPRPAWKLSHLDTDTCGGVPEGKFPELFNHPDTQAGCWK